MPLEGQLDVTVTGSEVAFTFAVRNGEPAPVDLEFRSGKRADLVVYDDGAETWRWSDGRMFTQAVETETVAPDQLLVHESVWLDPPPGRYVAEASLAAANVTLVEREQFEV
jgi:hypothetical protein